MGTPASADTFLHHLLLVLSPRSFFAVATMGINVRSCFHGRKRADFFQVSPSFSTGEILEFE